MSWFRLGLTICVLCATIYNLLVTCRDCRIATESHVDERQLEEDVPSALELDDRPQNDVLHTPELMKWKNDYSLVHIVLTRFMQHQPKLLHLGRARLELFKSFCLPTMRKQTTNQFLWIIRADPELHPDLKSEFLSTLIGINNVVVVGSNARVDDGHFRHRKAIADIDESNLWLGSLDLVRSYHVAAQNHTVLETGLDADDGLSLDFVEYLQTQTVKVAEVQEEANVTSWWKIWCVNKSSEWQFFGPYLNSKYGHMTKAAQKEELCITPGLSRVSTADYRTWKESHGKQKGGPFPDLNKWGHRFFIDHYYVNKEARKRNEYEVGGWSYIPGSDFQAVRARSPTSAGMKDVVNGKVSGRKMTKEEQDPWFKMLKAFGLSMAEIGESRDAIMNNMVLILKDALKGQCSEGHSCKNSAKQTLSRLHKQVQKAQKKRP